MAIAWNDSPNSGYKAAPAADGSFVFPMKSDLDVTITLSSVTAPGTVTVSRTEGDVAATGLPASGFIDQAWTISAGGGLAFGSATLVLQYDEAALGGLAESQIDRAWRDSGGSVTELPITLDTTANTATITGVTGFSTWYLGNETLVPVTLSGFELE